jgi:CRP-like cAMP-binding protein
LRNLTVVREESLVVHSKIVRTGKITASPVSGSTIERTVRNKILLSLPAEERHAVVSTLEFVSLPAPVALTEEGVRIEYAYFINDGLASALKVMRDGNCAEVGLRGREGFVGLPLVAGFSSSSSRIIMQVGGSGFRASAKDLAAALKKCPALVKCLRQFAQESALQAEQFAACNRLHSVNERLATWLLMCQDRLGGNVVPLTHTFLAHMLGTRRASVTEAAGALQKAELITCGRGRVIIRSRRKLEDAACECYAMLKQQIEKWDRETNRSSKHR